MELRYLHPISEAISSSEGSRYDSDTDDDQSPSDLSTDDYSVVESTPENYSEQVYESGRIKKSYAMFRFI